MLLRFPARSEASLAHGATFLLADTTWSSFLASRPPKLQGSRVKAAGAARPMGSVECPKALSRRTFGCSGARGNRDHDGSAM